MNRCLDKGNGLARWSKAGSTTTPCPPTFACSVRSASMLSTSGGARSGGAARRTSRHGKGSKVSRVNGCLLPRSSIRGRLTASASNTRGGSRMRESRSYGSERGAFSNGRPYRDRTDGHLGAVRSRVGSPLGDSLARTRPLSAELLPFAGPSFDIGEEERTFIVISASRRRKEPKASAERFREASTTQKSPPLTH